MEPEDLPWPGELEEEEEEEEEKKKEGEEEAGTEEEEEVEGPTISEETVLAEEVEDEAPAELHFDFSYEFRHRESTDDEEDEEDDEAKAWLQAHPGFIVHPPSSSGHGHSQTERASVEKVSWAGRGAAALGAALRPLLVAVPDGDFRPGAGWPPRALLLSEKDRPFPPQRAGPAHFERRQVFGASCVLGKTEFWQCLPQGIDSSQTLDTSQTRINVRVRETEGTDLPSLGRAVMTQSEDQVKKPNRDFLCSPLLVMQDSFASPDLPLLTCLTQDQEFGPDSLLHQSELDFAPLRGVPDKSEDTEWFSRPSEVSEALFQATSEVPSDLFNSCLSISQHPLTGNTTAVSPCSVLPPEKENSEESILSYTVDALKAPKDSDNYDTLYSYMSWKTHKDTQQPESNSADKDQVSLSTLSDISDENRATKRSEGFVTSRSDVQYWKSEALQQAETCAANKDLASFPHDGASLHHDKMSYSFLRCLLERRGKGAPLACDSHYFENGYVQAQAESEVKQKTDSLEGYERNEGLWKDLCQYFDQEATRNNLMSSEVHSKTPEIKCTRNFVIPDNSVEVSEAHILAGGYDISEMEASGGPLHTAESNLNDSSRQLYCQEGKNQKTASNFEGLPGKAQSAVITVDAAAECCSQDGNAVVCIQRVAELQREPTGESEFRSSDLRMLRFSPDTVQKSFRHLSGVTSKEGIAEIIQCSLKACVTTSPGDSNIGSHLPASLEDLALREYHWSGHPNILYQQVMPDGHLTYHSLMISAVPEPADQKPETTLSSTSDSYREEPGVFYQQELPESHLAEDTLKVAAVPGPPDQKTGILQVTSASSSQREKPSSLYQGVLTVDHLADEATKVLVASGPADQKTGIQTVASPFYSQGYEPGIFYQESLPDSHLTEETLKTSTVPGAAVQKSGTPTISSTSDSHREEPGVFYQRELPESHLAEDTVKVAAVPGPPDQKTGIPPVTSVSYSQREKPSSLYQEGLPGGRPAGQAPKVLVATGPAGQRTGIQTVTPSSYLQRNEAGILYQEALPDSHLTEETLKVSTVPGPAVQKSGTPTISSTSDSHREEPGVFYQQELPESHLAEDTLKVAAVPGPPDQKTGILHVTSASSSQREKPSSLYQGVLTVDHLADQAPKVLVASGPADQKTRIQTVTASYSQRNEPGILYLEALPDSHLTEETLKVSTVPGPAVQKSGTPTLSSTSYSRREEPGVFYQQELPESHLAEDTVKVAAVPGTPDQKTRIPPVTSVSYSQREKPSSLYQEGLPGDHLAGQAPKVLVASGPAGQKSGIQTVAPSSYSQRGKPGVYQQALLDSHLTEETLKVSTAPGPAVQKTGTPTVTSFSYTHGEEPGVFYQQVLPETHLAEKFLNASVATRPADQKTGLTAVSTSISHGEKSHTLYPLSLPESHLTDQDRKVLAFARSADQKAGTAVVSSTSSSHREKSDVFYQQKLTESHLIEENLKVSGAPGLGDQNPGILTVQSGLYSQRENLGISYQQALSDSHPTKDPLKVSAVSELANQKAEISIVASGSYSHGETSNIVYLPTLSNSQLNEEAVQVSVVPEPGDQKSSIHSESSGSYSHREKSVVFSPQNLPDSHLLEEPLKVLADSRPVDQKPGIPAIPFASHSHRKKSSGFYQQKLPDSHPTEQFLEESVVPDPADRKTKTPAGPSLSYSHREKPIIFYQQVLSNGNLPEKALKVSASSGSADQTSGIPGVTSVSYTYKERPNSFYQQKLPDSYLIEGALKVSSVPRPAEQKTEATPVSSAFYKPSPFHQHVLPDSFLTEDTPNVSAALGPDDQKTGVPIVTSASYSHIEEHGVLYHQALLGNQIPGESLKISSSARPAEQKIDISTIPSVSYSLGQKSIIYQQTVPGSHLPTEVLNVLPSPGPAGLKTAKPTVSSNSYSIGETPGTFYQQDLPDSQVTEEGLKLSLVPGLLDKKSGTSSVLTTSYSEREKNIISYQQELSDSDVTAKTVKVSVVPGSPSHNTGIPAVSSTFSSHREKPSVSYQQEFSDLSEETLKVLDIHGPAEQKTGIPIVTSTPYSQREKAFISYQQELPGLTEEALKVVGVPGPSDQKTGIYILPSAPYPGEKKPIISYQQELPHLAEKALKVLAVPGPSDQKSVIYTAPSLPYSQGEQSFISYQQKLPDLSEGALKTEQVFGPANQKPKIQTGSSGSYSRGEKPSVFQHQELSDITGEALDAVVLSGPGDQKTGIPTVPLSYYSPKEKPSVSSKQELRGSHSTEEALEVAAVSLPTVQRVGTPPGLSVSYFHGENPSDFHQPALPDSDLTEEILKASSVSGLADQTDKIPAVQSSFYSHKEQSKVSTVNVLDDQKTKSPTTTHSCYLQKENPRIDPDVQKTPLVPAFHSSYSQRLKPGILFQEQLPDRDQSEGTLKISAVPEPTDKNAGIPIAHREKSNIFYSQELPHRYVTEDVLKVSAVTEPANQKTVLSAGPSSAFSYREKQSIICKKDVPDRQTTEEALKVSAGLWQADQTPGLPIVSSGIYLHGEKHKLVSEHVQRVIDNLNSSDSSVNLNNIPLNSRADGVITKPESSGCREIDSEEIQDTDSSSKTLKEIRTLLMEAENIALKRCNFPAPLIPFRDVNDISLIQSKKVVCFKEPPITDVSNGDLLQRQPGTEENPNNRCFQKDMGTQTNLKCQGGIENWEFISSTTIRNPLQEAESQARVAFSETLRQYEAAKSVMRSEPEGYNGVTGNKTIIPMMTVIKSESSSDASDGNGSCSWDSNLTESLESVSDVLLNFFPYASPKTSITDSREEEGTSESENGSVDSLAAHVRHLLQCESSLNHAKQILRNAEEEECRVRAQAWNLKFNLAHGYGYSISELNEDDRRKVEEIKAKLFGHGRPTDLPEDLRSPRGIGCTPEPLCGHIIFESHEKGCFRTLMTEHPESNSHPCVFRSSEPSEVIKGQRCSSPLRARHINFSKSLDENNPHFRVWNSLQLQSPSPFQNVMPSDFKIGKDFGIHEEIDPWLSEFIGPACLPPKEMVFPSSRIPPPEPVKQITTSITFSSHRHSKCISDSSVFKVGVTEGSRCTGTSVGVLHSHVTEEQTSRGLDLKQKTSSPSSLKTLSHSPDKDVTILPEVSRQSEKLPVDFELAHHEEKLLETSDFKTSPSEPKASPNCSSFKEVQFSDNHTLINNSRPNSTLGVKEKNKTPDLPSLIFLEQRELFEQSKVPHADHHVRKPQSSPLPNLPSCIFLEQRELFEQSRAPHTVNEMRENHSSFPQSQNYVASDLPSPFPLEQCQSKAPIIDDHMRKHHFPFPQGQNCVVEKNQHTFKSPISNNVNVEATFNNVIPQSAPDHTTLVTSAPTAPSNKKALSCVRITLCPKAPSSLDSGTLDKRFHSLDPSSETRMNSEFDSDLQTLSSRSLEPTSKFLASKPVAQNQESLGVLGPKSTLDFQVVQSPLPDSSIVIQDLKIIPSQNSQITTSKQIQVNISDLEGYSKPEETPVSADRLPEQNKTPFTGKLSSDAVTQITTESPEKTMFSSEIFINTKEHGSETLEPSTQKLPKVPVKFASSSTVRQITSDPSKDGQPVLLPYKPSGSPKMYYVPQLGAIPSVLDFKSDTTVESSHSGSNDAVAPDFPAQVLGTRDDELPASVNIKHKEGIYSKRAGTKASSSVGKKPFHKDTADGAVIPEAPVQVPMTRDENLLDSKQKEKLISQRTKTAWPDQKESSQKDTAVSGDAVAAEHSAKIRDLKDKNLSDTKATKQKEIHIKKNVPTEAWMEEKESLQIDISESECHSEFENTTHSVFRSAKFYIHHPVHLPNDQDFCHDSIGRSVFMRQSWKDFFQHHSDKHKEHSCILPPYENVDKTNTDYTRKKSLSISVNLGDKEVLHTTKSQPGDLPQSNKQIAESEKNHKVTPEQTAPPSVSLNELWNRYQERQKQQKQKQQKPPEVTDKTELSLVERLDRLAKLLQNPITHSLLASESTQDGSRGVQCSKKWSGKQLPQLQKSKLQKQKRYKSLEKGRKNVGSLKKHKVLSPHTSGRHSQIKIEQLKFDKYILRRQPGFNHTSNSSSDSRPSEESELFTDTPPNVLSTSTSADSDILTQTDGEMALHERSSSISTIDTARLIQAFGRERVCLSPRRIKLYTSITNQQRRYLEKRCRHQKAMITCDPQMNSEHTRRKHIQMANHMISSESVSSRSSQLSSNTTLCQEQKVHMLNKGIQTGNLEIVNGAKKHTRDVGVTFPTPSSSEARLEEDSDMTSLSEEKIEEKKLFPSYSGEKKIKKNKQSCCEGVSWFVPVENVKSGSKKENLPKTYGPGITWFEPITKTKPWREPLREQNWQGQYADVWGSLDSPGRDDGQGPPRPFVKATLQESLQLHRPDFISRSGERIKRLKLIVQERQLQTMLQSERDALFNALRPLPKRVLLTTRKNKPIGKKEMIQRSKRIYEQLPEVQKKREEEKRRSEYKSYRLRAQLYKKKVTSQLLGRKVPWN
ncbi:centrosome-associated protein ALMS1 [Ctenodactylus gundi]